MELNRIVLESFVYNPVSLIFLSYLFGVLATEILKRTRRIELFFNKNYLSDVKTRQFGVLIFLWLINHSFMGKINRQLGCKGKADETQLKELMTKMTYSEVGHLFGFFFLVLAKIIFLFWDVQLLYILALFFLNIIFNFYLVLIQQYNKRRIRRLLLKL